MSIPVSEMQSLALLCKYGQGIPDIRRAQRRRRLEIGRNLLWLDDRGNLSISRRDERTESLCHTIAMFSRYFGTYEAIPRVVP